MWFVALWLSLGLALGCGWVARDKGRDMLGWGILGAIFPVIGLVVLALLPPISEDDK